MRYVSFCADFFRNALEEPATGIGLALLVVTVCLLASNIFAPPAYGWDPHTGLPVLKGGMDLLQRPLDTTFYLIILAGCGFWLQIRLHASLPRCGWAAVRITLLAGAPILVAALLILSGLLRVIVLGPGEAPTTFRQHGFALTYYTAQHHAPAAWLLLLWVVLRLPEAFFLGVIGGLLGRGIPQPGRSSSPLPA